MNAEDRETLRRLEAAATPGPWERSKWYQLNVLAPDGQIVCRAKGGGMITDAPVESSNSVNSDLIIAMRNELPGLLDAAAERDEMRALLVRVMDRRTNAAKWSAVRRDIEEMLSRGSDE